MARYIAGTVLKCVTLFSAMSCFNASGSFASASFAKITVDPAIKGVKKLLTNASNANDRKTKARSS
ncbi:hypothetical protein D3C77_712900 [compost metagenome]